MSTDNDDSDKISLAHSKMIIDEATDAELQEVYDHYYTWMSKITPIAKKLSNEITMVLQCMKIIEEQMESRKIAANLMKTIK